MGHEGYHEPTEELSEETRDIHRAITSLMEDWRRWTGTSSVSTPPAIRS